MQSVAIPLLLVLCSAELNAQSSKPIPCPPASLSKLSPALRTEVGLLHSDDAGVRATAAQALGERGAEAAPAIPWIIQLLQDDASVIDQGRLTPVAFVAASSLVNIGGPAVGCVTSKLTDQNVDRSELASVLRVAALVGTPELLASVIRQVALFTPATDRYDDLFPALVYTLGCFLPDARAFDGLLHIGAQLGDQLGVDRRDEFLLRKLNQTTDQTFTSLSAATDWWEGARSSATLKRVRWEFYCYVPDR